MCAFCVYRASELAFALDPLPKDELPPPAPFTEVFDWFTLYYNLPRTLVS